MKQKVLVEFTIPKDWNAEEFLAYDLWESWCEANRESFPEMLSRAKYRIINEKGNK